jgi:nitric oxide reductase subunit B
VWHRPAESSGLDLGAWRLRARLSADWLHRRSAALRDQLAGTGRQAPFTALAVRSADRAILRREMRTNATTRDLVLTVSDQRATAGTTAAHFEGLFTNRSPDQHLRELSHAATRR